MLTKRILTTLTTPGLVFIIVISGFLLACQSSTSPSSTPPSISTTPAVSTTPPTPVATSPSATSPATQSPASPAVPPVNVPPSGGVLNIIKSTVPNTLGPVSSMPAPGATFLLPAVEPLIGLDKDGPVPTKLATSWDIAADGKSLTLHLRKGVKFHDGTDFNAEAVKYNLDLIIGVRAEVNSVTSVDVIDEYTVKLNLKEYSNTLLYQLAWIAGLIQSPTALQTHDSAWFSEHMVGTGPFEFVSYTRDVSLVFKKFNNYWDTGKPYLDGLRYNFIVDPFTAEAFFRSGGGNLWDQLLPSSLNNIANMEYQTNVVPRTIWMAIGDSATEGSPFAELEVRQALEYAVDKKAVVNAFGFNTWEAPVGPISSRQFGSIPNFQGRSFDPAKAKQLVVEAGYPNGFKTNLYARNNVDQNVLVAFQAYLKNIGITAEIRPVDTGAYGTLRQRGWSGILMTNLGIAGSYAKMLQTDGPSKTSSVSAITSPEYTAALARAMAARDKESELKLNQELVQLVFEEAIMIPWLVDSVICVYAGSVHVDLNTINLQFWNPGDSWISK